MNLKQLTAEQAADDKSNYVTIKTKGHNPTVSMPHAKVVEMSDAIQAKHENGISWGEPASICQAKLDKRCPVCGKTRQDGFQLDDESCYCPERTNNYKYSLLYGREFSNNLRFGFDLTQSHFTF